MLEALAREGLLPEGLSVDPDAVPAMTPALCQAIHIYLARSTSAVVLANVEDGLEELSQTNLPGTIDAHPNWNRKYAVPVETLPAEPRLRDLASVLRSTRSLG
jgi:4-alpha-glucanotransferase